MSLATSARMQISYVHPHHQELSPMRSPSMAALRRAKQKVAVEQGAKAMFTITSKSKVCLAGTIFWGDLYPKWGFS